MCKTRRIIAFLLAMLIAIPTISLSTVHAAEEGSDITKITVVKGKDINDIKYDGSPMAVAVMTKKALELAEDKRVRTLLASIVAGIVIVMLIPLLVMVSIFNTQAGFSQEVARIVFDGGPIPTDIDGRRIKIFYGAGTLRKGVKQYESRKKTTF